LTALAGSVMIFVVGILEDIYDADIIVERTGYILGGVLLITYMGSVPFFILAGNSYSKIIIKEKIEDEFGEKLFEDNL
jgi:hypothetical protein